MKDLDDVRAGASADTGRAFAEFCQLISALREPGGCPWDAEQTHASIAGNMTEEAAEAVDAILDGDSAHLCEELGDVLLEVVLQAQIAADAGEFDIDDVVSAIDSKIVRRHPHVFGAETSLVMAGFTPDEIAALDAAGATGPDSAGDLWELIKARERSRSAGAGGAAGGAAAADGAAGGAEPPRGLLDDVPRSLPALQQAAKISKRAVGAGFEWESTEAVWEQVDSERAEFAEALAARDSRPDGDSLPGGGSRPDGELSEAEAAAAEEFGDILFSLVNVARREHIDPEAALRASCDKFRARWAHMERRAAEHATTLDELDRETLEDYWREAKQSSA